MISHQHQCIFVHIPKTAGNSINRVFGVGWEDHKDLQRYFVELPPELFSGYFKFAIVRNPWDRLFSDYNYQRKKSRAKDSKLFVFTDRGQQRDFAAWVETALANPDFYEPGRWGGAVSPHIHRWSPQLDWIEVDGAPKVDFVAHLERLPEDFQIIRQRTGVAAARLPHRNRRLHWHYSRYYDRATQDIVASYYARDIEAFGYEFERALMHFSFAWPGPRHRETEPAERAVGEARNTEGCTVSFATPRHPPVRRPWSRRPGLVSTLCCVLLFGLVNAASWLTPANASTAPQQFMRRLLVRSSTPSIRASGENPFVRALRAARSLSGVHVMLQPVPTAVPSLIFVVIPKGSNPTPRPVEARSETIFASVSDSSSGSGSGPAPRWWIRRNQDRQRL